VRSLPGRRMSLGALVGQQSLCESRGFNAKQGVLWPECGKFLINPKIRDLLFL